MAGLVLLVLLPVEAASAAAAQAAAVRQAEGLQSAGDFAGAIQILRAHLTTHPDDGDAARLLALTLYWTHDLPSARTLYDEALQRHPTDHRLRLEYGRMLVETGDGARARPILLPLRQVPPAQADAETLLGTVAYWEGDLTGAARLFTSALHANSSQTEASRQLREIRMMTAPWMRVSPSFHHDDQPIDQGMVAVEAGWFPAPGTPVRVRVQPTRIANARRTSTMWSAESELRHFVPALNLDTEVAAGMLVRTIDGERAVAPTGRGALALRLPHRFTIGGRLERMPYLHTTASLDTSVMTNLAVGELHWNHPRGWLGQATIQQHRYPDDNVTRVAYAWLMAPLIRSTHVDVQGGYAVAAEDSENSRFVLANSSQPYTPDDPRFSLLGRYDPYYTPANVLRHSLAAAMTVRVTPQASFKLNGAYAVHATEDAPSFVPAAGGIARIFIRRQFSPWDARASIDLTRANSVTVAISTEVGRSAFYHWARGSVALTYRFAAAARRDAQTWK